MKYSKIYVGVLNNKNVHKINELQVIPTTCSILLSNLDILKLNKIYLDIKNVIFIPNNDNIIIANKYKTSIKYTLLIDWLLKQPKEITLLLNNNSLLYAANKNYDWNKNYNGELGYGITKHTGTDATKYYGYSASIPDDSDNLILTEFDGYFLKNI